MLYFNHIQFSSVQDGIYALGKAHNYALHPVSRKFLQYCLWNGSSVRLIDSVPLLPCQRRLSRASSFHASLLQVINGVMSLALCPQVESQAQHFRSSETHIHILLCILKLWIFYACGCCLFVIHVWYPRFPLNGIKKYLSEAVFFTENRDFVYKKTQQRLYLPRKQKRSNISPYILESVHRSLTESVLTFNIVLSINQIRRNGGWYQNVPSLMRSLNGGNIQGTKLFKIDVWRLYMDFCFTFAKWLIFWIDLTKHLYIYEKRFSVCVLPTS